MTAPFANGGAVNRPSRVPVERRAEDRWLSIGRSTKRPTRALLVIAAGSLLAHGAIMGALAVTSLQPVPPKPQEIAVEVVKDVPKPPEPKAPEQKPPEPPKQEAKAPPPPPKVETAKVDPPKAPPPAPPPPAAKPPQAQSQVDALQKELAELRAEQAALKTEAASQGTGPLAGSRQAVALPTVGEAGDGDAVDYQAIVFSQLAKAKGIGQRKGQKGTAGVRFEIDDAGALLKVDVVTPSGVASLDAEALDIVRRAAPFPAPPKDAQRQFFANVNFVPQGDQ